MPRSLTPEDKRNGWTQAERDAYHVERERAAGARIAESMDEKLHGWARNPQPTTRDIDPKRHWGW